MNLHNIWESLRIIFFLIFVLCYFQLIWDNARKHEFIRAHQVFFNSQLFISLGIHTTACFIAFDFEMKKKMICLKLHEAYGIGYVQKHIAFFLVLFSVSSGFENQTSKNLGFLISWVYLQWNLIAIIFFWHMNNDLHFSIKLFFVYFKSSSITHICSYMNIVIFCLAPISYFDYHPIDMRNVGIDGKKSRDLLAHLFNEIILQEKS